MVQEVDKICILLSFYVETWGSKRLKSLQICALSMTSVGLSTPTTKLGKVGKLHSVFPAPTCAPLITEVESVILCP